MLRLASVSLLLAACATTGAVDSALHGDLSSLRAQLVEERRRGDLDRARVAEIAQAVAAREIHSGTGTAGARRIHSLRACSKPLLGELAERADRPDEGGAEATLVLVGAGRLSGASLVAKYAEADSAAWRAVAARAATTPAYFAQRRKYFLDPDERVRRGAFEAAIETPSSPDLDALLEAARLDPDPVARSLAVRAAGRVGGERAARGLRDLWERAEQDVRLAILGAYATKPTFMAGGREALLRQAESERGLTAVAAAGELSRVEAAYRETAVALFIRALANGDGDERHLAVLLAPLDHPAVVAALKKTGDVDPAVRVAALEKLAAIPSERARATDGLRKLAKGSSAGEAASQALARLGDASIGAKFRTELAAKSETRREAAGRALVALGDWANAATLLGDGSADVRVATACTILAVD